jgi:Ca-activated chloride channel family protein
MYLLPKINTGIALLKSAAIVIFIMLPTQSTAQTACSIALVLAQDVSTSVDSSDFHLQKKGLAEAFRDMEVINLIKNLPGGISVTLTQWSGQNDQQLAIVWNDIKTIKDAHNFANKVENDKRMWARSLTATGNALLHADHLLRSNPTPCNRHVIDLSSDGRSNSGLDASLIADEIATKGITINALVITNQDISLIPYFQQNIIRGAGSFVQPATSYRDYATAIKQKLIRELTPAMVRSNPSLHIKNETAFVLMAD